MRSLQLQLGATCALAALSLAPMCNADTWDRKTTISLTTPIEVPGKVLLPGTYVFKLLNSSSNRHIVQITNEDENRTYALTFTAAAHRLEPTDRTVLTFYEGRGDSPRAIRTWFYPGEVDGQEFIYNGKERAQLVGVSYTAPLTGTKVEESASTTKVETETPSEPAKESAEVIPASKVPPPIEVKPAETQPAPEEPNLLAQVQTPAPTNDQPNTEPAPTPAPSEQLPQTASELPLIALCGFSAIALALALRKTVTASR